MTDLTTASALMRQALVILDHCDANEAAALLDQALALVCEKTGEVHEPTAELRDFWGLTALETKARPAA